MADDDHRLSTQILTDRIKLNDCLQKDMGHWKIVHKRARSATLSHSLLRARRCRADIRKHKISDTSCL